MNHIFNNIIQVGMITNSLIKSMEKYCFKYNICPFYVLEFNKNNVKNMSIDGREKNYSMNIGVSVIGKTRFELIQPLDYSNYNEFNNKYNSGIIHHLKIFTKDYIKTLNYLASTGIKSLQSGHQCGIKGKSIYNYLDTSSQLGFVTELVDVSSDFIKPEPDYWFSGNSESKPIIFNELSAIGIVCENLLEKIDTYKNLFGIGPWKIINFSDINIEEMYVNEKKYDFKMKIAYCKLGDIQIKLIEPLSYSIYSEFLEKYKGIFIHHLRFSVNNYISSIEYLKKLDIKIMQRGKYKDSIDFAYFDTTSDLGFITELVDNNINRNFNELNLP